MLKTKQARLIAGGFAAFAIVVIAVTTIVLAPLAQKGEPAEAHAAESAVPSTSASEGAVDEKGVNPGSDFEVCGRDEGSALPESSSGNEAQAVDDESDEPTAGIGNDSANDADSDQDDAREPFEQSAWESSAPPTQPISVAPDNHGADNGDTADTTIGDEASGSPQRTWVVDYKQVWVPDIVEVVIEPERTETVYEMQDFLSCNVAGCGFTTQGNSSMLAHWKQHLLNEGIDEGWASIPMQVEVGTQTIPAVTRQEDHGSFQLVEDGGHWE